MALKNVFDKENPNKELESLNDLNLQYMLEYLDHHLKHGTIDAEKVEAYYRENANKSPKDKKRAFALAFMPDLLKPRNQDFNEQLWAIIQKNKK